MIPVGDLDPDRVARAAASARRDARKADVEAARSEAEVVLERLLVQWRQARASETGAYLWEETAREAADAMSELVQAVDRVRGPRLVRQRTHS